MKYLKNITNNKKILYKFTIIELFIVIIIILTLTALLLPVLNKVKERSKRVICVNSLRQNGTVSLLISKDNDTHIISYYGQPNLKQSNYFLSKPSPRYYNFGYMLTYYPELKETFYCPSNTKTQTMYNSSENPWPPKSRNSNVRTSYNMHPYKFWGGSSWNIKAMPQIEDLGTKGLYTDDFTRFNSIEQRHKDGIFALFVDGHVSWQSIYEVNFESIPNYGRSYNSVYQSAWDEIEENQ